MKIAVFGLGKYINKIENLLQSNVEILFYIDNDLKKQKELRKGKITYSLSECPIESIDYVVVTAFSYDIILKQLTVNGIPSEKICSFYGEHSEEDIFYELFYAIPAMQFIFECKMNSIFQKIEKHNKLMSENILYEMMDRAKKESVQLPNICTVEETLNTILNEKASISRFGDGEFQIIFGAAKDVYQDNDERLAKRLKEILISNVEGHLVALADDYGCMDGLREENKDNIRQYMTPYVRRQHYKYIDMNKKYYNAYVSRPYVIYPHNLREAASQRFKNLRKIWNKKDILIVEGDKTRMGVGNDLLSNSNSIKRIIAPNENAFSVYEKILESVLKISKEYLVLIALGPAATVLAYDLAKKGYWAIDIGHLDLEYEWFLKGEGYSYVPNKYNNEVPCDLDVLDICDKEYEKSIINIIK